MPDGPSSPVGLHNAIGDARLVVLDNGLTIIVREDHSAPVVSVQAWAKTGSIHEGEWLGAGLERRRTGTSLHAPSVVLAAECRLCSDQ